MLLGDRVVEGGFTNKWRRLKESIFFVVKQQRLKTRGIGTQRIIGHTMVPNLPLAPSILTTAPSTPHVAKTIQDDTFEELIKSIKELKVETSALKRGQRSSTLQSIKGSKELVVRCIRYKDPSYKGSNCNPFANALKEDIITFNVVFVKLEESSNFGSIHVSKSIYKVVQEKIDFILDDCIAMCLNGNYKHHIRIGSHRNILTLNMKLQLSQLH